MHYLYFRYLCIFCSQHPIVVSKTRTAFLVARKTWQRSHLEQKENHRQPFDLNWFKRNIIILLIIFGNNFIFYQLRLPFILSWSLNMMFIAEVVNFDLFLPTNAKRFCCLYIFNNKELKRLENTSILIIAKNNYNFCWKNRFFIFDSFFNSNQPACDLSERFIHL